MHSGREKIYACFSRAFLGVPDESLYEMLGIFCDIMEFMKNADLEGIKLLLAQRSKLNGDELAAFDLKINREYTQLYCLSASVPMTESVYTSPDGLTLQKAAGQIWQLYQQYGFKMNHSSNEHNDHNPMS